MSQFNPAAVQEAERSLNLRFRQPHAQNDRMLAISMVGEDSQSERIRFSVSTAIYRRAHPEARGLAICLEGRPRTRSAALQRGKRRVLRINGSGLPLAADCSWSWQGSAPCSTSAGPVEVDSAQCTRACSGRVSARRSA